MIPLIHFWDNKKKRNKKDSITKTKTQNVLKVLEMCRFTLEDNYNS